jgi:branched-chain amino acid transport system substrate-binding protein
MDAAEGERWGFYNALVERDALLADAIKRAGTTDGPKLRDALAATKNFAGVTGVTNIDANRDASKPAAIIAIKGGKLEFLKTVAP